MNPVLVNIARGALVDTDALVVAEAFVGNSLVMKRFMARGRGKSARVEKPFSHLTIIVRQVEEAA